MRDEIKKYHNREDRDLQLEFDHYVLSRKVDLHHKVMPTIKNHPKDTILIDRSWISTMVYQQTEQCPMINIRDYHSFYPKHNLALLLICDPETAYQRILKRNFDLLCNIIPILQPKSVLPFAGSYIIGGKNYYKNEYLGTTTWDECAEYLNENLKFNSKVFCLRENQNYDIKNQKQLEKYEKLDVNEMKQYIQSLKDKKYEYENDQMPDISELKDNINLASTRFKDRVKRFDIELKSNVYCKIKNEDVLIIKGKDADRHLYCDLDLRLLNRILHKKAHWNNAEIGTHINFKRTPNKMDPDVHTCLSFFHL